MAGRSSYGIPLRTRGFSEDSLSDPASVAAGVGTWDHALAVFFDYTQQQQGMVKTRTNPKRKGSALQDFS